MHLKSLLLDQFEMADDIFTKSGLTVVGIDLPLTQLNTIVNT